MGSELIVPLVAAVLSGSATAYNQQQTAKEQDRVVARGLDQQAQRQREADARVSAELQAMERSSPDAARKAQSDAFLDELRRTRTKALGQGAAAGNERYFADEASARGDVYEYGREMADTLARMNAPALQRMQEGHSQGRLATDLSTIGRAAQGDAFLNELRARSVRRNPWIDAAAQAAMGAASGMASSGVGSGYSVTSTPEMVQLPSGAAAKVWRPQIWKN